MYAYLSLGRRQGRPERVVVVFRARERRTIIQTQRLYVLYRGRRRRYRYRYVGIYAYTLAVSRERTGSEPVVVVCVCVDACSPRRLRNRRVLRVRDRDYRRTRIFF